MKQPMRQPSEVSSEDKDQQIQVLLREKQALYTKADEIIQTAKKEIAYQQSNLARKERELARLRQARDSWKKGLLGVCLALVLAAMGFGGAARLKDRRDQRNWARVERQQEKQQAHLDRLFLELLEALYVDIGVLEETYAQRSFGEPFAPVLDEWQSYPRRKPELVWRILGNGSVEFKGKGIPLDIALPGQVWAEYGSIVEEASASYGVPVPVMVATIAAESNGKPLAVSPKGARGLMQLMPTTAAMISRNSRLNKVLHNLLLPEHNVTLGGKYIASFGDEHRWDPVKIALMYNMGVGRLKTGELFDETRVYVQRWVRYYNGAIAVTGKSGIPGGHT